MVGQYAHIQGTFLKGKTSSGKRFTKSSLDLRSDLFDHENIDKDFEEQTAPYVSRKISQHLPIKDDLKEHHVLDESKDISQDFSLENFPHVFCPKTPSLHDVRDFLKTLCLKHFGHDVFQNWLGNLFPLSWDKGILTLGVSSSFLHHWIELHYLESLSLHIKKSYKNSKIFKNTSSSKNNLGPLDQKDSIDEKISICEEKKRHKESLTKRLSMAMGSLPPLDHIRLVTLTSQEAKEKNYPLMELLLLNNGQESQDEEILETKDLKALPGFEDYAQEEKTSKRRKKIPNAPVALETDISLISDHQIHGSNINPLLTFDTFVVGAPNEFASLSAQKIAQSPDILYNPFFLYGPVGHGKTHLMHAIANKRKDIFGPKATILYLSSEQFMYDFVRALRYGTIIQFKERFRHVDMLLLDDFQFIGGKEATQEEFFHIFNFLLDQKAQLIISADKSPKDLVGIQERMRSRLGWGLMADLHPTTFDLRLNILETKAKEYNVMLSGDILEFLAQELTSNVRQLEGALKRLKAHEEFSGDFSHWTLDNVKFLLINSFLNAPNAHQDLIKEAQSVVQDGFIRKKKKKISPWMAGSHGNEKLTFPRLQESPGAPFLKNSTNFFEHRGKALENPHGSSLKYTQEEKALSSPSQDFFWNYKNHNQRNYHDNSIGGFVNSPHGSMKNSHGMEDGFSEKLSQNFQVEGSWSRGYVSQTGSPEAMAHYKKNTDDFSHRPLTVVPQMPHFVPLHSDSAHKNTTPYTPNSGLSLEDISVVVGDFFHIHSRELCSFRRQRCFSRPRQVAMFLAKTITTYSLPVIGRYFGGRSHTTVLHALETMEHLYHGNSSFKKQIHDLLDLLNNKGFSRNTSFLHQNNKDLCGKNFHDKALAHF